MLTLGGLVILAAIGGLLTFDKALFSTTVVRRCAVNNGECENESTCVEGTDEPNTIVSCECTVAWTGETCNLRRFNDEQCHFPFTYLNTTYTTCTDVGWGSFWCSTISEFHDGDEKHRSECQDLVPYPLPDLEKLLLSERLSIPVDSVFQMMFSSNSEFIRYWMEKNKAYDVIISPWQRMDNLSSNLFRNQTYKQKAHNVFIPSGVMSVTARQIYFADLSENGTYTVGSNYSFVGPPMSSDYYVTMRLAMRPVSSYISELRVSCAIRYHKDLAAFIKAILAAQIYPDMEKCYRALGEDLSTFYNSTQAIRMYQEAISPEAKSKLNPI